LRESVYSIGYSQWNIQLSSRLGHPDESAAELECPGLTSTMLRAYNNSQDALSRCRELIQTLHATIRYIILLMLYICIYCWVTAPQGDWNISLWSYNYAPGGLWLLL